jgi:hypothetical protein
MRRAALTNRTLKELALTDRQALKDAMFADLLPATIDALRDGLKIREYCPHCHQSPGALRWAVRNVLEIGKLVGAETQVSIQLYAALGVRDDGELKSLVEGGRKLERLREGVDILAARERALEVLELALREDPAWRSEVLARVGGQVQEAREGPQEPRASTNGGQNGKR